MCCRRLVACAKAGPAGRSASLVFLGTVLATTALAQNSLSFRRLDVPGYSHEPGRYSHSGAFIGYFPNQDRLLMRAETVLVQVEPGRWASEGEGSYYREAPDGARQQVLVLRSRRLFGADDEYGGWSVCGFQSISPSGEWLLGVRFRRWREEGIPKSADQDVVYNWQTEELLPLPETLDARTWIDEDHLAAVEKADHDPVTGLARTLLVWDLNTMSVAQRIPLAGCLVHVRFLSPGRLAVQVLPDATPERPENKPFWEEQWVFYLLRQITQLHPTLGISLSMLQSERAYQEVLEMRARLAAAAAAARESTVPESWEFGQGLSAFEADPLQVPDKEPAGPLYLLDLTDLENPGWELLLDPVTLGLARISPNGCFAAFCVPRPGYALGENPLVIYDLRSHRWVRLPEIRGKVRCWLPAGDAVLVSAIRPGAAPGSTDPKDSGWFEVDLRPALAVLAGTSESPNVAGGSK